MTSFRDRPIKQKLVVISVVTIGTALLLATLGNVLADSVLYRDYLQRDLNILARVIADNSTATLTFDDPTAANQILRALKARRHIDGACIYRTTPAGGAALFAQYVSEPGFRCPSLEETRATESVPMVSQEIVLDTRRIGTLLLFYDMGELYERIRLYGSIVVGIFLLASTVAFILSNRLSKAIVIPVARLVNATTAVAETGDYSVRAEKMSGDELGLLVDRFNEMLGRIQTRDTEIQAALHAVEDQRSRFEFMAESMPQKIFTATSEGYVGYLNRQWMEFTGSPLEEITGWGWTKLVHPDDVEGNIRDWKHSIRTGIPFTLQQRFRRADGQYRWHLSRAHAMRDEDGAITMWIGSNTEIHEQKVKEEELRRANEDLQQFAYSASHDLQEPIRNVAVYSEIVSRRYGHLLDADGVLFLGFLTEGGRRLGTLVNDLLSYTWASMADLSDTTSDASEVLQNVLTTLAEPISNSKAIVTFSELPVVQIGDVHLRQVFQNLIGNAVKYRSEEAPRIQIAASRNGTAWCFSVADNGIGIEPRYKESIFGVFKRLSHERTREGNGIGLAICQRVVERYGGRIWVESELGRGATFYFTLPGEGT